MAEPLCPLCGAHSELFYTHRKKSFFQCSRCDGIFLDPAMRLSETEEKTAICITKTTPTTRVIAPTLLRLRTSSSEITCLRLHASILAADQIQLWRKCFRNMDLNRFYMIRFFPEAHLLQQTYDVIACSEVMEHFYNPLNEFVLLRRMLNPGGKLCCMTRLVLPETDFAGWFYKNDATHVFFYAPATLDYICRKAGLKAWKCGIA